MAEVFHRKESPFVRIGRPPVAAGQSSDNAGKFYYKGKFDWYDPDIYRWNTGGNPSESVKVAANDPCPKGWRVPTLQELQWLAALHSEWTENEVGQTGMWFSGPESTGSAQAKIFLPSAGQRYWSDSGSLGRGMIDNYWSTTHSGTLYGPYGLRFDRDEAKAGCGLTERQRVVEVHKNGFGILTLLVADVGVCLSLDHIITLLFVVPTGGIPSILHKCRAIFPCYQTG